MKEDQWLRVETLYHAALRRDSEARPAFLAANCSDDDVRREVAALLNYDSAARGFIEMPAIQVAARAEASSAVDIIEEVSLPREIGPYKLKSLIGEGGMGAVYLASDLRLDRKVAIKLLPPEFTFDSERTLRFQQEARAASALNHPNIVTVYEVGQVQDQHYLVTEYVEGETLRQRIATSGKGLKLDEAVSIATQVASALDAAHSAGIIHRDIKPENLMIRKDGLVKVLDFGLVKLARSESQAELKDIGLITQTGAVMGTAAYMSPEQARGQHIDHRADIFSFGAMVYEMLSGTRAFTGPTTSDVIAAVLVKDPEPLREIAPQVPPTLERIVHRCLQKQPEKRFQATADLVFALESLGTPTIARQRIGTLQGRFFDVSAKIFRGAKRWSVGWLIALLTTALLITGLIVGSSYWRTSSPARLATSFSVTLPPSWGFRWFDAPAVSPDGRYIVYSAVHVSTQAGSENEAKALWLRRLDSTEAKPLAGSEKGSLPFWSPDSRFVAFWREGRLLKIDVTTGGSPETICDADNSSPGAWGANGVIIFGAFRFWRVDAMGGRPTAINTFVSGETLFNPRFLPDGDHFLYLSQGPGHQNDGIYVASLDVRAPRKLILKDSVFASYVSAGYLLYTKDHLLMAQPFNLQKLELTGEPVRVAEQVSSYTGGEASLPFAAFSASENGVLVWKIQASDPDLTQLIWFDRSGKQLGRLGEAAEYSGPALSPGEDRLVVAIADRRSKSRDLWIMQPILGASSRLTFDTEDDLNPRWTPDGKWIVFTSTHEGTRALYRKLADGSGAPELLLQSRELLNVEDISTDGRFLVFNHRVDQSEPDLDVLALSGERKRMPFLATKNVREDHARFSPNGRWIAYRSFETDRSEIFIRHFNQDGSESSGQWQVSNKGGSQPQWRADGKELFYLQGNTLMAVEVNTEGNSFSAGTPHPLFSANIEAQERRNRYIATKDGERFLVVVRADSAVETTIAVRVGWMDGLEH